MRKIAAFALSVFVLASVGSAGPAAAAGTPPRLYVLKHPRHEHCRAHYVRRRRTVRRRVHGHLVHRRQIICVHVTRRAAPVVAPTSTPAQPTVAPARSVRLHAHLDPSFVQDPHNPLAVVYSYSASATAEVDSVTQTLEIAEPSLPEGVLELYSDGRLACAINVGGSTSTGECPVAYSTLGTHTVTTTYISGATTATETGTEQIEPFATTVTLVVTPLGCGEEEHLFSEPKPFMSYHSVNEWCSYAVQASVADQTGNTPPGAPSVEVLAENVTLERRDFGPAATLALERETSSDAEAAAKPGKAPVWRCRVVSSKPPLWPTRQSEYNDGWGVGNGSTEPCGKSAEFRATYRSPQLGWRGSESIAVTGQF